MSAARTTDELLGELGDSLERAWRDPQPSWRRRPLRRGARVGLVLAIGVVLIGSTAAATLPQWAASPPAPGVAPSGAYAARGTSSGISWGLVVSACRRPMGSYSVVLQTADGSTGTACVPAPGARAVFYDVRAGVALAFGGLPPATARVVVSDGTRTLTTAAVTPGVAASRSGARFFVVALPGASSVRSLSGYTASGAVTEACRGVGCEAP